jgi:hypothetical protein
MKRTLLVAATALALSAPAVPHAHAADTEQLMKAYYDADGDCRGSIHPDSAKTHHACAARAAISGQLEGRGYCFSGSFGYNSAWKFAGSRRACKAIQAQDAHDAQLMNN